MARIKITDLPLLQDLTEEQLKELFGAGARNFRPGMEHLEDRQLMSVSSLLSSSSLTLTGSDLTITGSNLQLSQSIKIIADYQPTTNLVDPLLLVIQPKDDTIDYYQSATSTTPVLTPTNVPSTGGIGIQGTGAKLTASGINDGLNAIAIKVDQVRSQLGDAFVPAEGQNKIVQDKVVETGNHLGLAEFFTDPKGSGFKVVTWSPQTGANLVEGLIFEEYGRVGGTNWGFATSDAYLMPGRHDAVAQFFWDPTTSTGKLIIWTQKYGAHATEGPIMEKALALGGGNGSGGYGVPISKIYDIPDLGKAQDFSWGPTDQGQVSTIVTSPNTGTHDLAGRIRDRWLANGLGLGAPTTDSTVHQATGNRLNAVVHFRMFTGGDFFSIGDPHDSAIGTTDKGTFVVLGEIYTAWYSNGGGLGFGIPTSDEHEADSVNFDASLLAWLGLRDQPQIYRLNTFRSSDGRQRTIYWSGDPGVGNPHFLFDYGNGQGPQNMDWTPKGGPNGHETKFIAEPLIPGSEAIGTTSAPLTVSPTYQSLPYAVGNDFGSLVIPQFKLVSNSLLTNSVWSDPNLWSGTPARNFAEFADFADFQAPADFDVAAVISMPMDATALVNDSAVEGVTAGDADGSQATPVPVFTNIGFALTDDNGTAHQLQIIAQTPQADGSATFQGVWDADTGPGEPVAGTLVLDDAGNAHLTFSGANESFDGIISGDAGLGHLDGSLTLPGADPVHIAGDQTPVFDTSAAQTDAVSDAFTDAVNASGAALGATAGQAVTGPVATFTSTDPNAQAGDFTATILWDAADPNAVPDTSATVAYDEANQVFTVSGNYTYTLAGSHDVRVSIQHTGGAAADVQAQATVDAAAASQFVLSGMPTAFSAGVAQQLTVVAQDAFGNTVTGYTGSVRLSSSDKSAVLPAAYTFTADDQGSHTFALTLKTAGTQSVTVSDATSSVSATVAGLAVNPAASLRLSAVPTKATAGTAFKVTLTALDAAGHTATGYRGTVRLSSSDGYAAVAGAYTFTAADKGVHTFMVTLKTAGSQWLKITDQKQSSLLGQASVSVVAGAAKSLVVSNLATSVAVGAAQSLTLTARDAYGNVVTGYVGTVSFSSTDKKAVLPARYTFKATDHGVHSFAVTFKTHGSQSLTIADAAAAVTFKQAGIAVA